MSRLASAAKAGAASASSAAMMAGQYLSMASASVRALPTRGPTASPPPKWKHSLGCASDAGLVAHNLDKFWTAATDGCRELRRTASDLAYGRPIHFVLGQHPGLFNAGLVPFAPSRQRHYRVHIGVRARADLDAVSMQARHHRRIHGVGGAKAAKQERSALTEAGAATAPDFFDAAQIGRGLVRQFALDHRTPHVHRQ